MSYRHTIVLFLACFSFALSVAAHEPVRGADDELVGRVCSAPTRPENDQDDAQWQTFVRQVEVFRACVSDKMQWHELAAVRHNENARQAIEHWNEFVQSSLNAPEDFPWPE
ncbi:MAG: hypothetical protein AAF541_04485 [Pseudomonadota bacterium]